MANPQVAFNAAMALYINHMNGDKFLTNDGGSLDVGNDENVVEIGRVGGANARDLTDLEQIQMFSHTVQAFHGARTPRLKNLILAARFAAYSLDLLEPDDNGVDHNCSYNESLNVVFANEVDIPAMEVWVDPTILELITQQATNIVCHLAYFFRARGHHYKESFEDDIVAKWSKNLNCDNFQPTGEEWKVLFVYGLHAIFPDTLDEFYVQAVNDGHCCRPLMLRVNVPCAGTAPYFAMLSGLYEVELIFPDALKKVQVLKEELIALCVDLKANRWKGGVNRKFYGAPNILVNESRFAPLAALVYGLNTPDANESALGKSTSLARVAKNAPMTTVIVRSAATGILRRCVQGEVQGELGDRALKQIMFDESKA